MATLSHSKAVVSHFPDLLSFRLNPQFPGTGFCPLGLKWLLWESGPGPEIQQVHLYPAHVCQFQSQKPGPGRAESFCCTHPYLILEGVGWRHSRFLTGGRDPLKKEDLFPSSLLQIGGKPDEKVFLSPPFCLLPSLGP